MKRHVSITGMPTNQLIRSQGPNPEIRFRFSLNDGKFYLSGWHKFDEYAYITDLVYKCGIKGRVLGVDIRADPIS